MGRLIRDVAQGAYHMIYRGGSRNSLKGGFWARILRRWGLGSRSVGIFIY